MNTRTVSLVLGSGGARGLAHIGVIRWLASHGFRIRSVAGSSMGALVGGVYAADRLDTYESWARSLRRIDTLRLLDVSLTSPGLIKGERIISVLRDLVGDWRIEELPVGFTAVATDLYAQKEVWLKRGPLFEAIRASIAIPTLFTPCRHGGRYLVDGGLINPVPIAPTLADHTDLTIAVSLAGKPDAALDGSKQRVETPEALERSPLGALIGGLQTRLESQLSTKVSLLDVLAKSNETMQNAIARFQLAAYAPDAVVEIPRNVCTFYEFYRAAELIDAGQRYAARVLTPLLERDAP